MRRREDEPGDAVLGAAELEPVGRPDREVGLLARLERADVVAAQDGGPAARPEPQRLARGHRLAAATAAGDEQRLLHLHEQVAALVRRRAVDPEPDAGSGVDQLPDGRDAGAEPEVRRRAVRDARPRLPEARDLVTRRGGRSAHTRRRPSSQPSRSRYSTGEQP